MAPSQKEIYKYYEEDYLTLCPSLHLEDSEFKSSEILSLLKPHVKSRMQGIVDLGCGGGAISKNLSEKLNKGQTIGVDLSTPILKVAKCANGALLLVKATCEQTPIRDESADIVILIDLLEHLRYPEKAIAEAARVTSRWVIIRVPLEDCLYRKITKRLRVRLQNRFWKSNYGHLWEFGLPFLINLLQDNGLKVIEVHTSKRPFLTMKGSLPYRLTEYSLAWLAPQPILLRLYPARCLILAKKARKETCL